MKGLVAALVAFLCVTFGYDWYFNYAPPPGEGLNPLSLLFHYDEETLQTIAKEFGALARSLGFAEDAVDPEIHLFEGGHFLLESALPEGTELMRDFLVRRG